MLQARSLCLRARKKSDDLTSATVPAGTLQARSLCLRARKKSDDLTSATVPAGTSLPAAWRDLRSRYAHQAATSLLFDQLNSVPSTHMRCRMTASLRATA